MIIRKYFKSNESLGEHWFRNSQRMILLSGVNGEIYAANDAFLEWIGYSMYEFVKDENPVTWFDITVKDDSLEADKAQAEACLRGDIKSYHVRKYYIPKKSIPHLVELRVMRYPAEGKFKFFVVEIEDLKNGTKKAFEELVILQQNTTKQLTQIANSLASLENSTWNQIWSWLLSKPYLLIFLIVLICFLLFGRGVIEILTLIGALLA